MSPELSWKLETYGTSKQLVQVILTAPQAEIDRLGKKYGLRLMRRLIIGGVFVGTATQILDLSNDQNVGALSEDSRVFSMMSVTTASTGANQVWAGNGSAFGGLTGRGVGIAVLDSGASNHSDLRNRMRAELDFTNGEGVRWGGRDTYGHGTHVQGIIAGSGAGARNDDDNERRRSKSPYIGMAPGAELISVKVLGDDGSGYVSDVIEAIDWLVRYKEFLGGVKIINLSLGRPAAQKYADDPLAQAVERAVAAGILVVASAGNLGKTADGIPVVGAIVSPGFTPGALTVGALNTKGTVARDDDEVASYSSMGPVVDPGTTAPATPGDLPANALMKPDVVAPGNAIVAAMPSNSRLWRELADRRVRGANGGTYMWLSGSSMATAVTTGAAALLLQARPDLTPYEVKTALQVSAEHLPGVALLKQGAGSINVPLAIRFAKHRNYATLNMSNTIGGKTVYAGGIAFGKASTWGDTMIWDNSRTMIWDNQFIPGNVTLWGETMIWDNTMIWDQ